MSAEVSYPTALRRTPLSRTRFGRNNTWKVHNHDSYHNRAYMALNNTPDYEIFFQNSNFSETMEPCDTKTLRHWRYSTVIYSLCLLSLRDWGFTVINFRQELRLRNDLTRWIPCNIFILTQLFTVSLWFTLLGVIPTVERSRKCIVVNFAV